MTGLRGQLPKLATRYHLIWVIPAEEAMARKLAARHVLYIALLLVAVACGSDSPSAGTENDHEVTLTLVTHDSFAISDGVFETFHDQTGIKVQVLTSGDVGSLVTQTLLSEANPVGDVIFGVDNTFMQRLLDRSALDSYETPELANVPDEFKLDPTHRLTPIDYGDVCINYWIDALDGPAPTSLMDLVSNEYKGTLVVQNPETSSPGMAFLLATIAGTPNWEEFWTQLRANDVAVTNGWEAAYYGDFIAGGGDRPLVVSYASSPVAEVIYADPPVETPPTGVLLDSCFRQIEFAGILAGTEHPAEARALIDFLLSPVFQNEIPMNMFMYPTSNTATLPPVFVEHSQLTETPLTLLPAEIEAHRQEWTERWVEIVLG
jgi:thiamine transport system substrate-binding protein